MGAEMDEELALLRDVLDMMLADCSNRHYRSDHPFPCACSDLAEDLLTRLILSIGRQIAPSQFGDTP